MVRGVKSTGVGLSVSVGLGVPGASLCCGVKYGRPGTPTLRSGGGAIVDVIAWALGRVGLFDVIGVVKVSVNDSIGRLKLLCKPWLGFYKASKPSNDLPIADCSSVDL